jgi:hypothetical protein
MTMTASIPSTDQLDSFGDGLTLTVARLIEVAEAMERIATAAEPQQAFYAITTRKDRTAVARLIAFVCEAETQTAYALDACGRIKRAALAIDQELRVIV